MRILQKSALFEDPVWIPSPREAHVPFTEPGSQVHGDESESMVIVVALPLPSRIESVPKGLKDQK
jgi:hypothetical protein